MPQTIFSNDANNEMTGNNANAPNTNAAEEEQVKECWVCRADSTEDTPETSPWRDPCPCALVAHEECLLDWIASKENSKTNRQSRLECPQCKGEIRLARPRDYLVEAVRGFEYAAARMVTPGALTVLFATVYNSSMAWGIHSIYTIFGERDGFRILRPLIANAVRPPIEVWVGEGDAARRLVAVWLDHMVHWRLYTGLPLITPVLILSRTTFADSLLPVLPVIFFATQVPAKEPSDFMQWPPSASMAFALLPYLRAAYNTAYRTVFAAKEKEWLRQIQPRAGEAEEEVGAVPAADPANAADDENFFEVRIDGNIWEDWEDDEEIARNRQEELAPAAQQMPPIQPVINNGNNAAAANDQAQPPPNIADDQPAPNGPAANPQVRAHGERRLSFSPTTVAETVLGAILFPTIAGLSGEILKLVLPRAWTNPMIAVGRKGLLHEKWGRSILGGCFFVVCKDALMLYVRWRMAQIHRRRRVVDIDRSKAR